MSTTEHPHYEADPPPLDLTAEDVAEIRRYAAEVEADPELAPVRVLFPEWRDDVGPEQAA